MRISFVRTSLLWLSAASIAFSQDSPIREAGATPSPSPIPAPVSTSGVSSSAPSQSTDTSAALDYLFNRKPQDGSVGKKAQDIGKQAEGKAVAEDAVGMSREKDHEMRARFKRYLETAEVSEEALDEYFTNMREVSRLLVENQIFPAWKKLHDLAVYTVIDAGISRELANRVESIWNMDKANASLHKQNESIRKDVKIANRNADIISERIMEREAEIKQKFGHSQQRKQEPKGPQGGVPTAPEEVAPTPEPSALGLEGKLQLTEEYLRSLELKARIKFNELKQGKLLEQAKTDFADYITTLFNSGRFNHVVLAADFYRRMFQEGEYPANMAKQVNASLEVNRDVQSAVDVFRYNVERGQLAGATDSLQQAFSTSELNPAVLGLQRPLKEKVADFNAKLDQTRNLIEARDFGNLEILLKEMKQIAKDFDATKPMAIVNAVKLESKIRLGKAKLAAQQGDLKMAMDEFQFAAEAWPGNPDLEDNALRFFDTQDAKSRSLAEFDRFTEEQNYRAIFEGQLAFAPAIKGDAKREEGFKTALEAVKAAEIASEKANALVRNGDFIGAWEVVELASVELPDDKKLNKLRADLSGRSAEFVAAVSRARDAEGRHETGYSLTWYVNAQRQYPASQIANQGIERLSKTLLSSGM